MDNIRRIGPPDSPDQEMIEGFQLVLQGLKKLPITVCMSLFVDDYIRINVINMDGVQGCEKEFHVHMVYAADDPEDDSEETIMVSKHDNDGLARALAQTIDDRHRSALIQEHFNSEK